MPTDLENSIQSALRERADAVVLREPERRRTRASRQPRHLLLVAAAVLAVLAIAIPLAVVRSSGGTHSGPSTGDAGYVGAEWRVTAIDDEHGHLDVPDGSTAYIAFDRDGKLHLDDGVNTYTGRYEQRPGGFSPGIDTGSAVGSVGNPASPWGRLMNALDKILVNPILSQGATPITVPASVTGDVLTVGPVARPPLTVTLMRAAVQVPSSSG